MKKKIVFILSIITLISAFTGCTYKNREKVDEIIDYYVKNELPIYDFISDDGGTVRSTACR